MNKKILRFTIPIFTILILCIFSIPIYASDGLGVEFGGLRLEMFNFGLRNGIEGIFDNDNFKTNYDKNNNVSSTSISQFNTGEGTINNANIIFKAHESHSSFNMPTSIISVVESFFNQSDLVSSGKINELDSVTVKYKMGAESYKAQMNYNDARDLVDNFQDAFSSGSLSISATNQENNITATEIFTNKSAVPSFLHNMDSLQKFTDSNPENKNFQELGDSLLIKASYVNYILPNEANLTDTTLTQVVHDNNLYVVATPDLLSDISTNAANTQANQDILNTIKDMENKENKENNINNALQPIINSSESLKAGQLIGNAVVKALK